MRTILLISPYWQEEHRWMKSTVRLAELWQRLGYRVCVACMGTPQGVERVADTLTIHRRKDRFFRDPWNYGVALGFGRYVRKLVEREQPNVIVVNKVMFWSSLTLIPLALRGHRVVLVSDVLVGHTWWPRHLVPRVAAFVGAQTVGRLIMRMAHHVVLSFPQPTELLDRLGAASKTTVIPNGIDPLPYHQRGERAVQPTLTYVGRLESVKGVDDFLAAAVPLQNEYPGLRIRVVGPHKPNHPLVTKYGDEVEFTGYRDDVLSVYAESSVFVLASHSEGLSNALMEAMASGCACVASDVGGNPYLIEDGVSGLLYPRKDREALQSLLRRLLEDQTLRRELGRHARSRIEEHYNWTDLGSRWHRLFETIPTSRQGESSVA